MLTVAVADVVTPSLTVNVNESAPVWPAFGVYVTTPGPCSGCRPCRRAPPGALSVPLARGARRVERQLAIVRSVPIRLNVTGCPARVVWLLPLAVGAAFVTVNVTVAESGGFVPSLTV